MEKLFIHIADTLLKFSLKGQNFIVHFDLFV